MSEEIENTQQVDNQTEDVSSVEQEVNTEVVEEAKDTKETLIEKMTKGLSNLVKGKAHDEDVGEENVGDAIPTEFRTAATKRGMTDEQIEYFSGGYELDEKGEWNQVREPYTDEELLEIIPTLVVSEDSDKSDTTQKEETQKSEKAEDSQEDEKIAELVARLDKLEEAQGQVAKDKEQQQVNGLLTRVNEIFDGVAKEHEVFGETKKLPKFPNGDIVLSSPQMKARSEVLDIALSLYAQGKDVDASMKVAINAYKGQHLTQSTERKFVKQLKEKEKRLSAKRSSHEPTKKALTYGPDIVRQTAKDMGIDVK